MSPSSQTRLEIRSLSFSYDPPITPLRRALRSARPGRASITPALESPTTTGPASTPASPAQHPTTDPAHPTTPPTTTPATPVPAAPTLRNISLRVEAGQFVGIIGPNGSGKSTLLKHIYRALPLTGRPQRGHIFLDGQDLAGLKQREIAQKLAVVGQEHNIPFDFTAGQIVAMGRSPHKSLFEIDNEHDRYMVDHALEHLGISELKNRSFQHLSGGEKQRVLLARAIAQECDFFILDEPTNHLDIAYQMQIFDFIKRLKVSVLAAIHDLNMAALYCDYLYVLQGGALLLEGPPAHVLSAANLAEIFGVQASVEIHPATARPAITFLPGTVPARGIEPTPGYSPAAAVSTLQPPTAPSP